MQGGAYSQAARQLRGPPRRPSQPANLRPPCHSISILRGLAGVGATGYSAYELAKWGLFATFGPAPVVGFISGTAVYIVVRDVIQGRYARLPKSALAVDDSPEVVRGGSGGAEPSAGWRWHPTLLGRRTSELCAARSLGVWRTPCPCGLWKVVVCEGPGLARGWLAARLCARLGQLHSAWRRCPRAATPALVGVAASRRRGWSVGGRTLRVVALVGHRSGARLARKRSRGDGCMAQKGPSAPAHLR